MAGECRCKNKSNELQMRGKENDWKIVKFHDTVCPLAHAQSDLLF